VQIEFFGAAGEVTGSCHVLTVGDRRVLLDCGLIQGSRKDEARNAEPFPFDPASVDAVVLSHAHIDHSGRLPLLVRAGFRGPIHAQAATRDLCRIMLKDSGYLQEKDAEIENRKRSRKGLAPVEPLYTASDAGASLRRFRAHPYDQMIDVVPGIRVRFRDAGHILGSCVVEVFLEEGGVRRKLVFSGDLGQTDTPILRDPVQVEKADLVLMESTYGDRLHRSREDTWREIEGIVGELATLKGNVLIPAFAVGRSQEILYLFATRFKEWRLDRWQVFLDSPMAIEATEVYLRHSDIYDKEAAAFWREDGGGDLLPNLHLTRTPHQSQAINRIQSGAIIIAGSGMCTGGRIRHHLKNNVWRRDCHVVIVGYQARGTTGRQLVDGARHIRLWGETIRVAAKVHTVGGLSAHADQRGLENWYGGFSNRPPVVLVHGEARGQSPLRARLEARFGAEVHVARPGLVMDLLEPGRKRAA
jgi:metallo-beta-lactamase family protein